MDLGDKKDIKNDTKSEVREPSVKDSGRRSFIKMMGVLAVGAGLAVSLRGLVQSIIPASVGVTSFPDLTLVDQSGNPITTDSLKVNDYTIVLFNYPLQNEPNFLLRLGDANGNDVEIPSITVHNPDGSSFTSPGGKGPYKSVVASSAICEHLGCTPPNIRFYPPTMTGPFAGKIHCDCHGSTYDPYKGFQVVTGPTVLALPNVVMTYDNGNYKVSNMVGPTIHGHPTDLTGGNPLSSTTSTAIYTLS
ncbi:MAG: Rieske 2Fe-2S domain-containing protein [Candidatus Thermoplasmatota archaeon]|nr:Rieske 2Fe-2S domain-containing protein [Candidatus Thermoplasmatota archaeon]MCL5731709.1 Rieske 2Fe-2S domain-containing protein [Candidatus Thermoplasmatota archaeon]